LRQNGRERLFLGLRWLPAYSEAPGCAGRVDDHEPEAGADRLPVLTVGRMMFCGEGRLSEAAAARAAG